MHDTPGRLVPTATNMVQFAIEGPGKILGVAATAIQAATNRTNTRRSQVIKRSVFNGLAQIIVQSSKIQGEIVLTATAEGLQPTKLYIQSEPGTPRPSVP